MQVDRSLSLHLIIVNPIDARSSSAFPVFFFFNDTATTEIYTSLFVGSVRLYKRQALGVAQRALDLAVDYAQQRVTFGKPIASRQAIKFKLADMEIRLQTARAQLFYNAQLIDKGIYDGMLGSVTKTCVSEMVFDVANQALQIFGGYGYSREYPVEKLLRDARIFSLFEGTNEIQRMIIGGTLVPKKRN